MRKVKLTKKSKKYVIYSKEKVSMSDRRLNEVARDFERFLNSDDKVFPLDGTIFDIKEL